MNRNLSKLGAQLRDIWNQLGPSQRVSIVSATLVLVAGLTALAVWSSRTDYGLLYGKLSESESSKVIAALDDAKVPYKISSGGGSIMVPWASKSLTSRTSASPISSSAPITSAPCKANWRAQSASSTKWNPPA